MKPKIILAVLIAAAVVAIPLLVKLSSRPQEQLHPATDRAAAAATTKPLPRFVDLGTTTCAPCKAMLGVMAELEQKYPGAMEIQFINVQEDPDQAKRYGIQIIPSQIFYSPEGRELYRHTGVFRTEQIVAKWAELGFPLTRVAGK